MTQLRLASPALAGYAAARTSGLIVLWAWAHAMGRDPIKLLQRNDAAWYAGIAENGYTTSKQLAFFPLYPYMTRAVGAVLPAGVPLAGVLLTWVTALAAAWGLFLVGDHLYGRRAGILAAVVWGLLPHSIVQSMGYTEPLFTALCAFALYAVLRERWIVAGSLTSLAGLTRPTASSLIAVVGLAALVALWRRRDWRPVAGAAIAPIGFLAYLAFVAVRTGRWDGYFWVQHDIWDGGWDGGASTLAYLRAIASEPTAFQFILVATVLVLAIGLFALSIADRQPWQLVLFSALMLVTALGTRNFFNARARFLLPAFALLLPIARSLATADPRRRWVILGLLAFFSASSGGYLLLLIKYSP